MRRQRRSLPAILRSVIFAKVLLSALLHAARPALRQQVHDNKTHQQRQNESCLSGAASHGAATSCAAVPPTEASAVLSAGRGSLEEEHASNTTSTRGQSKRQFWDEIALSDNTSRRNFEPFSRGSSNPIVRGLVEWNEDVCRQEPGGTSLDGIGLADYFKPAWSAVVGGNAHTRGSWVRGVGVTRGFRAGERVFCVPKTCTLAEEFVYSRVAIIMARRLRTRRELVVDL